MSSELPIDAAALAVGASVALTVVLFLYSLGLRIARVLHHKSLRRFRRHWWPILAQAALNGSQDSEVRFASLGTRQQKKLLREWCRIRGQIKGSSTASLGHLADELELRDLARRLLNSHSVGDKLMAIQALGYLQDSSSWSAIEELLTHKNVSLSVTAATALVHINATKAAALIVPMIASQPFWPRTQVGRLLNLAGPLAVTGPLCRAVESAACDEACRLLQYYESASISEIDSLVMQILNTREEPTLIVAAMKAIRGQLPIKMIANFAQHRIWFVRLQAASLIGQFGRREDYTVLEPLLSDTEWWVRYRAAQAIVKLPFLGPHALRKLRDRQKDRYARNILQQALAEVGIE